MPYLCIVAAAFFISGNFTTLNAKISFSFKSLFNVLVPTFVWFSVVQPDVGCSPFTGFDQKQMCSFPFPESSALNFAAALEG